MKFKVCTLMGLLILLNACGSTTNTEYPDLGIKRVEFFLDSEELGELNNSSQAKRAVSAAMKIEGQHYKVGIHYAGKSSLDAVKKSFQVYLGDSHRYRDRSQLRFSAQFSDPSLLRSAIGFRVFSQAGIETPFIEPFALFLNGEYQGVYQLIEPIDPEFFAIRDISLHELYKAKLANAGFESEFLPRLQDAYAIKSENTSFSAMRYLWELVNAPEPSLSRIKKILDVDQYLHYIAACVLLNHWDGYNNNYFLARSSIDGKFRIYPWDLDRIYEHNNFAEQSLWGGNRLTAILLSDKETLSRYIAILKETRATVASLNLSHELIDLTRAVQKAYIHDKYLKESFTYQQRHEDLMNNMTLWLEHLDAALVRL